MEAKPAAKMIGKYSVGKTLGSGTFGKVKAAVNTETGERVAIKVIEKEKIQAQELHYQIKKEISIMKVVNHANVVRMHEVLASRTKIFIVLELVSGGELFDKIVAHKRFEEPLARFYLRQLIKGVRYCHGIGVYHRDLKVRGGGVGGRVQQRAARAARPPPRSPTTPTRARASPLTPPHPTPRSPRTCCWTPRATSRSLTLACLRCTRAARRTRGAPRCCTRRAARPTTGRQRCWRTRATTARPRTSGPAA